MDLSVNGSVLKNFLWEGFQNFFVDLVTIFIDWSEDDLVFTSSEVDWGSKGLTNDVFTEKFFV